MFYSKMTGGFYSTAIHGESLPDDVVEITVGEHAELLAGQSTGKRIVSDATGHPVLQAPPPPTTEQLRDQAKAARAEQVAAITVTTAAGHTFDGDEISQTRMVRAIVALQATGTPTVNWVLADNSVIAVSAAELTEALAIAGAAQAALWVI